MPAQYDLRRTWSDGSLRWCEVSCISSSIAPGGRLEIQVYAAAGTYNNTSTCNIADITATTDFKVSLDNLTDFIFRPYATGSSTASFNSASAIHLDKIKSGPICDQWRAWMYFPNQGGGKSDQLAAFFYVTAWTNPHTGSLLCISHITKIHNGWLSQKNPTKYIYSARLPEWKRGHSRFRVSPFERQTFHSWRKQ